MRRAWLAITLSVAWGISCAGPTATHTTTPIEGEGIADKKEPAGSDATVASPTHVEAAPEESVTVGSGGSGDGGGTASSLDEEDSRPPGPPPVAAAPPAKEPGSVRKESSKAKGDSVAREYGGDLAKPDAAYLDSMKRADGETGGSGTSVPSIPRPAEEARPRAPEAPALKAGRHDDNAQFNRFVQFLNENARLVPYLVNVSERVVVRLIDRDGKSLSNCAVTVKDGRGQDLYRATSFADGRTHFFPLAQAKAPAKDETYVASARCGNVTRTTQALRLGKREVEIKFPDARTLPKRIPVDIAIVIDTTGSMQGQIDRLRSTLRAIHLQLTNLPGDPDVRFGLVAYRDQGDDYVTQVRPFTSDVDAFQKVVEELYADGGGDTPEDLQAALEQAMKTLQWRADAVRMGFVIADAIPHTDYGQTYDYRVAMKESLERGIKWTMIGAGGLPLDGELIFRQIAQYSMGEYVFVTEAETSGDQSSGAGEASHHVGSNYKSENLDQAIVRIVRRDLSHLTNTPSDFDYTIVATADSPKFRDAALNEAVVEALRQLVDYSSMRLTDKVPVAVAPVTTSDKNKELAEYLSDQFHIAASRQTQLRLVERDLKAVSQELKLQLSDLFDVKDAVPIGKMLGAELLIVSKLTTRPSGVELFAKLVRVETSEILSVAKVALGQTLVSGK